MIIKIYKETDNDELFIVTNKGIIKGYIVDNQINWSIHNSIDLDNKSFFMNGNVFSNQVFENEQVVDIQNTSNFNEFNIFTTFQRNNIIKTTDTFKI